jgi:hypothetical protein
VEDGMGGGRLGVAINRLDLVLVMEATTMSHDRDLESVQ